MRAIDFCESVVNILLTHGWCKRSMLDGKGRSCLLGAIGRAAGIVTEKTRPSTDVYNKIGGWLIQHPDIDRALRAECAAAKTCGFHLLDNVIYYNDNRCFNDSDAINFIERVKNRLS